jgi:hypothetical protein
VKQFYLFQSQRLHSKMPFTLREKKMLFLNEGTLRECHVVFERIAIFFFNLFFSKFSGRETKAHNRVYLFDYDNIKASHFRNTKSVIKTSSNCPVAENKQNRQKVMVGKNCVCVSVRHIIETINKLNKQKL